MQTAKSVTYVDRELEEPMKAVAKNILMCLAYHSNDQGTCFPSYDSIREWGSITWSRATIKRHIDQLVAYGLIEVIHQYDRSGRMTSNLYRLNLPLLGELSEACKSARKRVVETGPDG